MDGFTYHSAQTGQLIYPRSGSSPLTGQPVNYADPFINYTSPFLGIAYPASETLNFCGVEVDWSPTNLGTSKIIYKSPELQDIQNMAKYSADWGATYHIPPPPQDLFTIEVTYPWDVLTGEDTFASEYTIEQWYLQPQEQAKSLVQAGVLINPFLPPGTNNLVVLPDIMKIAVNQALQNNVLTLTPPSSSFANYAPFIPYAQQILAYMRNGVTSVPSFTQTLQRIAVIDINNVQGAFNRPMDNLASQLIADGLSTPGFLISTQELIRNYAITPSVSEKLLPSYSTQISVVNIEPVTLTSYAGWRWTPPIIKPLSFRKMSITQNFFWDQWLSGVMYINSPISDFPLVYSPASSPSGNIPITS